MEPSEYMAQKRFDETYITSTEICERMKVSRPAVHFRRKNGHLPNAIRVYGQSLFVWDRQQIEPKLVEWENQINKREGAQ